MDDLTLALADICGAWPALQPPNRMRVSEGAAANLIIRRPGGAGGAWNPAETPYMVKPVDMLGSRRHSAVVFVGPAQSGKALDVDTPIATPGGWTTMGALAVGDTVFDETGAPTKVVFVTEYQHDRGCYEVEFSDGSVIVADADHRWGVEKFYWTAPNHRYVVRTTGELAKDFVLSERGGARRRYRYRIRLQGALQAPAAELEVDPYLLGVWLGDGSTRQAVISTHGGDALHYIAAFQRAGHNAVARLDRGNTLALQIDPRERLTSHCQRGHDMDAGGRSTDGYCQQCRRDRYHRKARGEEPVRAPTMFSGTFSSRLHRLGLHGNKHIPSAYLRASVEQRWQLLRGLMDTDGTCNPNAASAEFTTVLPALLEGFVELTRSLGLKPSFRSKVTTWTYKRERKHGTAFRVSFPIPPGVTLFSLPRKMAASREATTDVGYRQIVGIRPVASRPVKCIQVAAESHLYLAGKGMVPTHNTVGLGEGWLAHAVVNDPGDMAIFQMTQDKAREYSKQRIDRAIKNSPALHAMRSGQSRDDNLHDKQFRNGMWLRIAWPTATNMSSTSYRYVFGTDYDRWPDDIDGEGDGFTLMGKRTTTFLSRGMVAVESSPGRPVVDPSWAPATPHEAPPVTGVLGIYNRSDRRRWYWPCPHCREWLEATPGVSLFRLPSDDELLEGIRDLDIDTFAHQHARVPCPHCGSLIRPGEREAMNRAGQWLEDGLSLDAQGRISGTPRTSSIAGFWLGGAAATYVSWETLIRKHLQALLDYELTGSELSLQTTANTDQCVPYMSRLLAEAQAGRGADRFAADLQRYIVPSWARFLVASVDVQGGRNARFVVQVHAVGEHMEQALVDRYSILWSKRPGMAEGEFAPIDPAAYPEDWDLLTEKVVKATYRLDDGQREMRMRLTVVDTGGEDGVTNNAYAWYRRLRRAAPELAQRVRLSKGANTKVEWHIRETMVGGRQGHGDVPLYLLDPNKFKDMVSAGLQRRSPGPSYYHWPQPHHPDLNPRGWLQQAFFDELHAEVRNENGVWEQVKKRNETFDLCYMIRAGCMMLGADKREFWASPPPWALPLDENSDVITPEARRTEKAEPAREVTLERRMRRSSYLG